MERDSTLEALSVLLKETGISITEPTVAENLAKAQDLLNKLRVQSKGILSKFCLDGQVALVTGGGGGIGSAFAHALGEAGCSVAVADIDLHQAEVVAAQLEAKGIKSLALKVDVSNKEDAEAMVAKVISTFGDLHIAFNNAGIVFVSDSESTTETEWTKTLGVNLNGVFFCCQAEAKHMLKKGYGKIINTASMSGSIVNRPQHQVAYNTSKAAIIHMTKTLGSEWASRGVCVNCISPGYINTGLSSAESADELKPHWIKDIPAGRLGEADDLTGACVYLASPLCNYTTGLDLIIDGGYTCW